MITGLPARVAWPWLGGGLVANIISARTLMAAYRRAPFAVSYPITRGLTPPLVAVAAAVVTAEVPSKHALLGIAAVSLALLVLAKLAICSRMRKGCVRRAPSGPTALRSL